MSTADIVRTLFVSLGGLLIGYAFVIAVRYGFAWSKTPRSRGLLPLHVWVVATSYCLFLGGATAEVCLRIGNDSAVSWRIWVYGTAYILGLIAMWAISKKSRVGETKVDV